MPCANLRSLELRFLSRSSLASAQPTWHRRHGAMMADLREHIQKEEAQDLALAMNHVSDKDREAAGKKFQLGKKLAPTRPHAEIPNNKLALESAMGLLLKPVDTPNDLFTPFPANS